MPYRETIMQVVANLDSDMDKGLTQEKVVQRQREYGKNTLQKKENITVIAMFFAQLKDPMVMILMFGAGISILLKEYVDAGIIVSVILLNAIIGVFQEYKAEKAIETLKKLSEPKAYVIREGYLREIPSEELVIGDVVELEAGRYIPADMRLLSASNLKVEESTLTGESEAVLKDATQVYNEVQGLGDQRNMVFMSTFVTYGKARGIVVATGMQSEVGRIARMLDETKEDMTPLQQRLAQLSKLLGLLCVGICIAMFVISLFQARDFLDMLLVSISLAVAAIPEGLPAVVTIVLALGVQAMSKQHAIVRRLHAVETLGSVSVICSDKTGTLTQNKMRVVSSYANGKMQTTTKEMLLGLALCNNAKLQNNEIFGEPTEAALLQFCEEQGVHKEEAELSYLRLNEISFDSKRKCMTTIHQIDHHFIAYTKGAMEKVLEMCTSVEIDGKLQRMSDYEYKRILEASRKISSDAQRVLGVARKHLHSALDSGIERNMTFLGFVGLIDPPRKEAYEAIRICHEAHIQVAMITGDHPLTALAIAKSLGIAKHEGEVMSGKQLELLSDDKLADVVKQYHVFARVTPEHKVRIVKAYKRNMEVVAMSGDGVNDAPSLKQADIGIAMGKQGTDVCKQASDMILTDDNFATIVRAVEQGRSIYLNIQKAVLYLLSCNLGEIMALFLAIVCMPHVVSTLSAIQILWVNLVTDAFPALSLGIDVVDPFLMKEAPRSRKESLFAHGGMAFVILNGLYIGTITLVAFRYGLNDSAQKAQSMAFMVLSIAQLFHALNLRSRTHSLWEVGVLRNKWLVFTLVFGILLQVAVCELPFLQVLLKTVSLSLIDWLLVLGLSISVIVINEMSKWIAKEH